MCCVCKGEIQTKRSRANQIGRAVCFFWSARTITSPRRHYTLTSTQSLVRNFMATAMNSVLQTRLYSAAVMRAAGRTTAVKISFGKTLQGQLPHANLPRVNFASFRGA
jgi:hypothetical protein